MHRTPLSAFNYTRGSGSTPLASFPKEDATASLSNFRAQELRTEGKDEVVSGDMEPYYPDRRSITDDGTDRRVERARLRRKGRW